MSRRRAPAATAATKATPRFRSRRRPGISSTRSMSSRRRHGGGRLLRRFDHRRHRLDAQRRRSLARRPVAPPARRSTGRASSVVNAGIGGNRVASPARYSTASSNGRRAVGPRAVRSRCRGPVGSLGGDLARRHQRPVGGAKADAVIAGMREIVARSRARGAEDLRRDDRVEPRQRHGARHARGRRRAAGHQRVHPHAPGRSTASSTSTWRRAIRRPAACARPSSPTARSADPAIGCIRTGPAIRRWDTPSISRLLAPLFAGAESRPPRTTRLSRSTIIG